MKSLFLFIVLFIWQPGFSENATVLPPDSVITDSCEIIVPNYFRGNGDSANDQLCVYGKCIQMLDLKIYDRWGTLVFESDDRKKCWNGRYKNKSAPAGTYFYILKATLVQGSEKELKGQVSIYR